MSFKDNTHDILISYYHKNGIENTIKVAKAMLESSTHKDNKTFHTHVHGEICETVLECIVDDYFNKFPVKTHNWFYEKGLIIKDIKNPNSGYFTELDFTVFTPQKLYAFECKSYGGDKSIIDKCKIVKKKGGSFDVYKQHEMHARVLSEQLNPFRKSVDIDKPAYQLILFDFALGETNDKRKDIDKVIMPCLNEKNVLNIFKLNENGSIIWNMPPLEKAVKIISQHRKKNAEKHLEYVKNLKH